MAKNKEKYFRCKYCGGVGNWGKNGVCQICIKKKDDKRKDGSE